MNKYKEAIKWFKGYIGNDCYKESFQNACKLAIESIEKATPKKVKRVKNFIICDTICPICYTCLPNRENYCPCCGQALDWKIEVQEDE